MTLYGSKSSSIIEPYTEPKSELFSEPYTEPKSEHLFKQETNKQETSKKPGPETSGNAQLIVDCLNRVAGTHYKANTSKTKSLIQARMNEGFSLEDFYTVIDKKVREWGKDGEMCKFLRPETLFGTKFESYLNQLDVPRGKDDDYLSEGGFV